MIKLQKERISPFFQGYLSHVSGLDLLPDLEDSGKLFAAFMEQIDSDKYDYRYAPDKWTIRDVFQHVIDTERILAYRALCFARGEKGILPGFDEESYGRFGEAWHRSWSSLLEEFQTVRESSLQLFRSFTPEQLERGGQAGDNQVYAGGLGFIIAGHTLHHAAVIRERYLNA